MASAVRRDLPDGPVADSRGSAAAGTFALRRECEVSRRGPRARTARPSRRRRPRPATRLDAPARTSPAANTPGRTVSSRCGSRSDSGQQRCPSQPRRAGAAEQVAGGVDCEHSGRCLGARVRADHHEHGRRGDLLRRCRRVGRRGSPTPPSPSRARPTPRSRSSPRSAASARCDRRGSATSSTSASCRGPRRGRCGPARRGCIAACPAELPPPTTITSSSRQRSASVAIAAW